MQKREGGDWWLNVILGLENIVFILGFFLSADWLNRFGLVRFQTLETETKSNRKFFVIF